MTQNEQKPESAEFQTREAHRKHIAQTWQAEGMSKSLAEAWADRELSEAEARGAAEQRRKDAEGAEFRPLEVQVSECSADLRASFTALDEKLYSEFVEAEMRGAAWQRQSDAEDNEVARWQAFECGRGWFDISNDERSQYGDHIRPLYTRPANVAALEARVKELKGVCKEMRAALEPFAECADYFDADGNEYERDHDDDFTLGGKEEGDEEDVLHCLNVGHLRTARSICAAAIREGGER